MPGRICGVSAYLEGLGSGEKEEEKKQFAPSSDLPAGNVSTSSSPPPLLLEGDDEPWIMVNADNGNDGGADNGNWATAVEAAAAGEEDENRWGENWDDGGEEKEEALSDAQPVQNDGKNDDNDDHGDEQPISWAEWAKAERKREEEGNKSMSLGGGDHVEEEEAWSDAEPPRDNPAYFHRQAPNNCNEPTLEGNHVEEEEAWSDAEPPRDNPAYFRRQAPDDHVEEEEAWSDAEPPRDNPAYFHRQAPNNCNEPTLEGNHVEEEEAWSDAEPPRDNPAYFRRRAPDGCNEPTLGGDHDVEPPRGDRDGEENRKEAWSSTRQPTTRVGSSDAGDNNDNDNVNKVNNNNDCAGKEVETAAWSDVELPRRGGNDVQNTRAGDDGCGEECPCSEELIEAVRRLYVLRDKFEFLLHEYPHYSSFIRDVCIESWAGDMDVLFDHLAIAENARASKLACRECARRQY